MFDGPEHASYIALSRELPVDPVEYGDWFWWPGDGDHEAGVYCHNGFAVGEGMAPDPKRGGVLLRRLDQWLTMLEEAGAGCDAVSFEHTKSYDEEERPVHGFRIGYAAARFDVQLDVAVDLDAADIPPQEAPTREEAAARLWMAVTGRAAAT